MVYTNEVSERLSSTDDKNSFFDGDAWLDRLYGIGVSRVTHQENGWVKEADKITEEELQEFIFGNVETPTVKVPVRFLLNKLLAMVGS